MASLQGGLVGVATAALSPATCRPFQVFSPSFFVGLKLDQLLQRDELDKTGIYILTGTDLSGSPRAYIGEAEAIRDRLKQHKSKEFWISAIVFVSKDENLTKAHVRYLESRLLTEATQAGRFTLEQNQAGGSKLPESDRADMEVFLSRIQQLLPVLGSDLLIPIAKA